MLHHKTKEKAQKQGVELTEIMHEGDVVGVRAEHEDEGCVLYHSDSKALLPMVQSLVMMIGEYPSLMISQAEPSDVVSFDFEVKAEVQGSLAVIHRFNATTDDDFRTGAFEAVHKALDLGLDPEGGAEEEEKRPASVVPIKYRKRYSEVSDGTNCGDWLALKLNEYCKNGIGKRAPFLLARFESILQMNNVDMSGNWVVNRNSGWQGRYRMTGRNMLSKKVADSGLLMIPTESPDEILEFIPPQEWIDLNKTQVKAKPKKKGA